MRPTPSKPRQVRRGFPIPELRSAARIGADRGLCHLYASEFSRAKLSSLYSAHDEPVNEILRRIKIHGLSVRSCFFALNPRVGFRSPDLASNARPAWVR